MTFTYYQVSASVQRGHTCPRHAGTFLDFLAHSAPQAIDILMPFSGQANAIARQPAASYILQKEPDGGWFIDQWIQDTAAAIRPIPARLTNDGYRAPACDNAAAYFIIDIG
jgi:hypothetical protein